MSAGQQQTELTERQRTLLSLVVEEYVSSGAPVGSKALVARSGMRVASSTVRYDLAQLEDHGYLTHPHTSAGRVPTESGYRFYVDRVLESVGELPSELTLDLSAMQRELDEALRATTEALAGLTQLLALATAPAIETTIVRHVEVLQLQPNVVVVVTITASGDVSRRVVVCETQIDPRVVEWAAEYLNGALRGKRLGQRQLRAVFGDPGLTPLERAFLDLLRPGFDELVAESRSVFVGGAVGVLQSLEAAELDSFRRLLSVLDERAAVLGMMQHSLDSKRTVVRVGSDLADPELVGVAMVGAPYGLPNRNLGAVSLLGPIRMDYVRAVSAVRAAARELSKLVSEIYE